MTEKITIDIQCFGAFREISPHISLHLTPHTSIQALKTELIQQIGTQYQALVQDSVFASDSHHILADSDIVSHSGRLAILPPVSGG